MCLNRHMHNSSDTTLDMNLIKPIYDEIKALLPKSPVRVDAHAVARVIESEDPALKATLPWVWGCFQGGDLKLRLNGVRVGVKLASCGQLRVLANFREYQRVLTNLLQQDIQAVVQRDADGFREALLEAPVADLRPADPEDRARLHFAASLVGVSVGELHSMMYYRTLH